LARRFSYLFAFLLPPQIQVTDFLWEKQGRELKVEKARTLETLSAGPFFHRQFSWTPDYQLRFPDANTGEWFEFNPLTSSTRSYSKKWDVEQLDTLSAGTKTYSAAGLRFRASNEGRTLELLDPKDLSKNVWIMDLPVSSSVEWSTDGRDSLWGLSRESQALFFVNPRSMKSIQRWNWDSSVEMIDLLTCSGRVQFLVEQPSQGGLTRFVRFRNGQPYSYTVFDLSNGAKHSDLTQALTLNCMDFYVGGPYGLQRIRY